MIIMRDQTRLCYQTVGIKLATTCIYLKYRLLLVHLSNYPYFYQRQYVSKIFVGILYPLWNWFAQKCNQIWKCQYSQCNVFVWMNCTIYIVCKNGKLHIRKPQKNVIGLEVSGVIAFWATKIINLVTIFLFCFSTWISSSTKEF